MRVCDCKYTISAQGVCRVLESEWTAAALHHSPPAAVPARGKEEDTGQRVVTGKGVGGLGTC